MESPERPPHPALPLSLRRVRAREVVCLGWGLARELAEFRPEPRPSVPTTLFLFLWGLEGPALSGSSDPHPHPLAPEAAINGRMTLNLSLQGGSELSQTLPPYHLLQGSMILEGLWSRLNSPPADGPWGMSSQDGEGAHCLFTPLALAPRMWPGLSTHCIGKKTSEKMNHMTFMLGACSGQNCGSCQVSSQGASSQEALHESASFILIT